MESKRTEQQLDNKNNRETPYNPSPICVKNGKMV